MKRFFRVFTIILVIFLVVAAGVIAVVEIGDIHSQTTQPVFFLHMGVTRLPFTVGKSTYPDGDLMIVKQVSASGVKPGDVVLYSGGSKWFMRSGLIAAKTADGGFQITANDGITATEPASSIKALYVGLIPDLKNILAYLESIQAIAVFAVVLVASFALWLAIPSGKPDTGALSQSDGEISSSLY